MGGDRRCANTKKTEEAISWGVLEGSRLCWMSPGKQNDETKKKADHTKFGSKKKPRITGGLLYRERETGRKKKQNGIKKKPKKQGQQKGGALLKKKTRTKKNQNFVVAKHM